MFSLSVLGKEFCVPILYFQSVLKEWVSFFLGSWGMNRSAEQTNRVNHKTVHGRFVCSALRFIPHEPRKKDTHSLCLQCFHQRSFQKFSEKSYKFKFLLFMDTLNLIWCKSLSVWFGQLANYFMTLFIWNWIENFCMVQWRKYDTCTIVNICR